MKRIGVHYHVRAVRSSHEVRKTQFCFASRLSIRQATERLSGIDIPFANAGIPRGNGAIAALSIQIQLDIA
jgi:hypothetical protein